MEKTPEKTLKDYDAEHLDFLKEETQWLEKQKTIAEQGLQAAESEEEKQKFQATIEKVGRYLAQNQEWMTKLQSNIEGDDAGAETDDLPVTAEAASDAPTSEVDDVDSAEEQKKSVSVETTNPYTGQVIVGHGATEQEAIADANQQINDYRDGMK